MPSIRQHRVARAAKRALGEGCSPTEVVPDGFSEASRQSRGSLI